MPFQSSRCSVATTVLSPLGPPHSPTPTLGLLSSPADFCLSALFSQRRLPRLLLLPGDLKAAKLQDLVRYEAGFIKVLMTTSHCRAVARHEAI